MLNLYVNRHIFAPIGTFTRGGQVLRLAVGPLLSLQTGYLCIYIIALYHGSSDSSLFDIVYESLSLLLTTIAVLTPVYFDNPNRRLFRLL
jgi:hypothetical protein